MLVRPTFHQAPAALALLLFGAAALPGPAVGAAASGSAAPARAVQAAAPGTVVFTFSRLNGAYSRPTSDLPAWTEGPLALHLSSPRNRVVVRSHHLWLTPLGDGTHRAHLEVEILGKGWVEADADLSGMKSRLEDEVILPPQTRTLDARLRIERTAEGYVFTPLELPDHLELDVQSRLAARLLALCKPMAALVDLDCDLLGQHLTHPEVPLPPPGEAYRVPADELTAGERQALDTYLAAAASEAVARGGRR